VESESIALNWFDRSISQEQQTNERANEEIGEVIDP